MQRIEWNHPLLSRGPDETWAIAAALVRELPARAVLALHGDLGAGKTCFVQGLALALGIDEPVTSPTFTLAHEYRGSRPLYHLDLYRLRGPEEIEAMGFDEYLDADGITAIEWADRAGELLPADTVHIEFTALELPAQRSILIRRPPETRE